MIVAREGLIMPQIVGSSSVLSDEKRGPLDGNPTGKIS